LIVKKNQKPSNEGSNNEENGRLFFHKGWRSISISGEIHWQLADELFNVLRDFESRLSRKPLTIYINSEGGDTYDMFKIYDHIKNSPLPIVTVVAGLALSAGFIIFLAGDLRKAFPNAILGFHGPTTYFCDGDSEGPVEAAELAFHQNRVLNTLVKIVKDNSNMPERIIRKYFSILTRINVETALKFSLVHQVINPPKKVLPKSWTKILKERN